ncbi:MAG: PQQ-dependent sugar dehydrogenase, partial [Limisphaerales bacterium]
MKPQLDHLTLSRTNQPVDKYSPALNCFEMLFQGWFKRVVCLSASLAAMLSSSAALKVELLVGGLSRPVFVCSPPRDSNRLFIVEQQVSRIRVFDRTAGSLLPTAFLTITGVRRGGEQGLLGLAFHPGFATNGYFFLNLNPSDSPNRTEIRRYRVQGDAMTNNVADATSM